MRDSGVYGLLFSCRVPECSAPSKTKTDGPSSTYPSNKLTPGEQVPSDLDNELLIFLGSLFLYHYYLTPFNRRRRFWNTGGLGSPAGILKSLRRNRYFTVRKQEPPERVTEEIFRDVGTYEVV